MGAPVKPNWTAKPKALKSGMGADVSVSWLMSAAVNSAILATLIRLYECRFLMPSCYFVFGINFKLNVSNDGITEMPKNVVNDFIHCPFSRP